MQDVSKANYLVLVILSGLNDLDLYAYDYP